MSTLLAELRERRVALAERVKQDNAKIDELLTAIRALEQRGVSEPAMDQARTLQTGAQ